MPSSSVPAVKLLRDLSATRDSFRGGAVSIGNFDGVHIGHARIVQRLVQRARALGGPALVFTFDPHPARLLRPQTAPAPLTWTERKAQLLGALGVDAVLAYPTDRALLDLEPEAFFQQMLCDQLQARALVEGRNFGFGRDRRGTVQRLGELAAAAGIELEVVDPVLLDGQVVSSSRLRAEIQAGDVHTACRMLTQPYRIRGRVQPGARRGAELGFPTANLEGIDTLLPAAGVYAGRGFVGTDVWPAAISIGPNPTFGDPRPKVEVHLIGYHGSLYGNPLEVDFLDRLRDIQTFSHVEELVRQIQQDVARAAEVNRAFRTAAWVGTG